MYVHVCSLFLNISPTFAASYCLTIACCFCFFLSVRFVDSIILLQRFTHINAHIDSPLRKETVTLTY